MNAPPLPSSEAQLRELVELKAALDQHALVVSTDSLGRITYVNDKFCAISGYTRSELLGQDHRFLNSGQPQQEFIRALWTTIGRGQVWHGEFCNRAKDGSRYWVDTTIIPFLNEQGQPRQYVAIGTDLTPSRHAQEQERQERQHRWERAQKLEALGTLAGGIAHEFNNLLAIILSYAELSKLECTTCPTLEPNLDEVIKAAGRAKDMVHQIQAYSLEQPGHREAMKLAPAVNEVCELLRNALPRGVSLDAEGVSPAAVLVANRAEVQQVLVNLCNNAHQALPVAGGRIQLRTSMITVAGSRAAEHGAVPPGRYLRLSVQDDGSGMDEATLARVAEPFFTTKPPEQGSGLGLSVVRDIMQAHGGAVTLTSKPGAGTTVHLYFPTTMPPLGATKSGDHSLPPANQRQRIMLVDDEQSLLLVNGKFLSRMGHEVLSYDQSKAALTAFELAAGGVDLVISDLNMPGLDGLTLVERMRQTRPEVPVILMTGFADEQFLARVQKLPAVWVLQKPVLAAQLSEAVQKALGLSAPPAGV